MLAGDVSNTRDNRGCGGRNARNFSHAGVGRAPIVRGAEGCFLSGIMKAQHLVLAFLMVAAVTARAQERLSYDQLPAAVKQTLRESPQQGPVKEATRTVSAGRTVYVIEIDKNNAPNPRLRIAEDGTLLREPVTPYVSSGDVPVVVSEYPDATPVPRLKLEDLPAAVQATARREAGGRDVVDVDRETWRGQRVYEIEFRERGLNARIYVADDGSVVRDEPPRRSLKSLLMGTQLEDTPAGVQEAVRRIAGEREIVDIDVEGSPETPVYRVEIRGPQGLQELRIDRDGRVIANSRQEPVRRG